MSQDIPPQPLHSTIKARLDAQHQCRQDAAALLVQTVPRATRHTVSTADEREECSSCAPPCADTTVAGLWHATNTKIASCRSRRIMGRR